MALTCLALASLAAISPLLAQSKTLEKANELYKNNQFADAAELYRQALQDMENEGKETRNATLLKSKLAYCYRMNNKMDKAEALYAEVVKDENAKADNLYYYGEALMSNGKYEEAKKWFSDYQKLEPTDEKAGLMLRACDYAPHIQPYFQYLDIQEFAYNTAADDNAPIVAKNGLIFSSDRPQGVKLLKEKSGWTGRDFLNLYFAPRKSNGALAEPGQYSSKLSEVNKNTGNASLTASETEIFFTRNDNVQNKQNTYSLQLFSAKSVGENRWKDVEKLPFCSSNFNFMHPAISPDGRLLFFATNRAGGFGGTDLWVSERKAGEWGKPENLGPAVNTTANEGFPFVGADNKLYFCSKGHPGFGGFDIFVTYKDENGAWQPATNLGKPINSPLDDLSIYVAPNQRSGFFASSRGGGDDDIYQFSVMDEAPPAPAAEPGLIVEAATPKNETKGESAVPPAEEKVVPAPHVEEVAVAPKNEETKPAVPAIVEMPKVEEVPSPTEETISLPVPSPKAEKTEALVETTPEIVRETPPAPIREIKPVAQEAPIERPVADLAQLGRFVDFSKKMETGRLAVGERFRLDGAVFDPGVWQLTPRITAPLNKLLSLLNANPSLQIEISAHTEALGVGEDNLRLSENRANTVLDYLLREGIAKHRLLAKGCGETMPVNHCRDGTTCSMDEHLVNQRVEVKVVGLDGKL